MPPHPRSRYLALRERYHPERVTLVLVAESPPVSGRYLYDPDGVVSEPLFKALTRRLGLLPSAKDYGLRVLQKRGWLLVDATYEPVNGLSNSGRDAVIVRDYPRLRDEIAGLAPTGAPIALIKANVRKLLEPRLAADGFAVANAGATVPFPSYGWQNRFHAELGGVLRRRGYAI